MATSPDRSARFLELHGGPAPLLIPNPWDVGSAKLLVALGFEALATTSGGYANSLGRLDGSVGHDEMLAHARAVVDATAVPVSADLENGYADEPGAVATTVALAIDAGLAGCSIEDYTGDAADPVYDIDLAAERIAAAAATAHDGARRLVLTARAENHLRGRDDLADTIARLQRFQQAGADVLYAPGLTGLGDIRSLVASVDRPVNVLALPGSPTVAELAEVGVRRISVGSAFALVALGAVVEAATELREQGTYSFWARASIGSSAARPAFAAGAPGSELGS